MRSIRTLLVLACVVFLPLGVVCIRCADAQTKQPGQRKDSPYPTQSERIIPRRIQPEKTDPGKSSVERTKPPMLRAAAQPTSEPTDTFTAILSAGMAPYTLHVSAVNITLAHGTCLTARYEWDFGDQTVGSKYNQLVGWNAAHIYKAKGTYPVTLTLTDEAGEKRVFKKNFIINPARRRIIYVSNHGNDQYEGDSPEQPVRSLQRAGKMLKDDTEVLLRRGDIFDLADKIEIKHSNIVFGSYDEMEEMRPILPRKDVSTTQSGSTTQSSSPQPAPVERGVKKDPVIRFTGEMKYIPMFSTLADTSDITFQDITFDSRFNTNTEKTGMPDCIKPSGINTTVRNCTFLNIGYGINCNGYPHGVMAVDCSCPLETGLRSYFAWVQGSDHVYLGNYVANSTREHCLRVGGADRLLLAYNDFSNLDRRDKDKGNDKLDTSKGAMTIHAGSYVYVANNTIHHGEILVGPLGKGDGKKNPNARWNWAVIENNRVDSFIYINHGTSHVQIRNNFVRRNDWACIIVEGFDTEYDRGNSDITIENNSGLNKSVRGNFLRVTGKVDGITLRNNLYIAPKLKLADDLSAPVFVDDESLRSFREISHNLWPDLKGFKGVNYVKGQGGYLTEQQWMDEKEVKGDRFETIPLPATQPTTQPAPRVDDIGAKLP